MELYAAYATNMDPGLMADRCPHSPMRGNGWLEGWRLTFGGEDLGWEGALATVVEEDGSRVFVVLYEVSESDERALDRWDGGGLNQQTNNCSEKRRKPAKCDHFSPRRGNKFNSRET